MPQAVPHFFDNTQIAIDDESSVQKMRKEESVKTSESALILGLRENKEEC